MPVAVTISFRNDNPDTIHSRLAARLGREPTHNEATARVVAIIRGYAPGDATLADIEALAATDRARALTRVREWLEQFSVSASDASFARAAALRAKLSESL